MKASSRVLKPVLPGLFILWACSQPKAADGHGEAMLPSDVGNDAGGAHSTTAEESDAAAGKPAVTVVGPGNDHCATATPIPLVASTPRVELQATLAGATHDIDPPCAAGAGPDVFYKFSVSKRVIVYADTFGTSFGTILYLLSDQCSPLKTTTADDAVCNAGSCGTEQSQIVAVLDPGSYRLGLGGKGDAQGAATIHFEWALAGTGTIAKLPQGSNVLKGKTTGLGGGIDGLSPECLAAGAENSYWWARCPADPGGAFNASTCAGTAWESVLELQLPRSTPYVCNLDGCGLSANLNVNIPAGAGLGVLSVDGQDGTDVGPYELTVTRP